MPVLRLLCQKVASHFVKQHKYALSSKTDVCRGISTSNCCKDDDDSGQHFGSRRSAFNFDTLGSWNNKVELPVNVEQSIKHGKLIPEVLIENVGVVSLLGRRKENEDRYRIVELQPNLLMFAIFDGHGGPMAADFACRQLERHMMFWLERGESDLFKILRTSFIEVNNAFTRHVYHDHNRNALAVNSGTTATVCLLRNSVELVTGHVGDSKALMCRKGKVVRLTHDHKPSDPREKERIKSCGGMIKTSTNSKPRVMGKLDMSRSIGDVELKPIGVTAVPDLRSIEVRHGKDAFLVLATDGVSYVMNDQEVVNLASTCETAKEAAQIITDQALHFGSEDNATAIVIPLGAWGKYANSAQTVQFSFGRNIMGRRYN